MKLFILKYLYKNKRIKNFIIRRSIYKLIKARKNAFPDALNIESTDACNANCIMCASAGKIRKKTIMDMNLYKKIVDNCARLKIKGVCLNNVGEPLIDHNVVDKIKYAKNMGIKVVWFFTNASLLDEKKSGEILESDLDLITFSLDGFTRETYNKIRQGLDFERTVNNIEEFLQLKKILNKSYPKVKINFVLSELNMHEKNMFYNYWKNKVDEIGFTEQVSWPGTNIEGSRSNEMVYPCWWLWHYLVVLADGRAVPCCYDYDGEYTLGNLKEDNIEDIWFGEKINHLREIHFKRDFKSLSLCGNCYQISNFSSWLTIRDKQLRDRL